MITSVEALSLRTSEFPQERARYAAARQFPHDQRLLVTQVNTKHQRQCILSPSKRKGHAYLYHRACSDRQKCMKHFGEESCWIVATWKIEKGK
jgi:hypothetical protein